MACMQMTTNRANVFAIILISLLRGALCGPSLRGGDTTAAKCEADRRNLVDLAGGFTHADGSSRLELMEDAMAAMFKALPKDKHGRAKHDVVQYALHRIFVHRRSWYVRGLEPSDVNYSKDIQGRSAVSFNGDLNSIPFLPSLLQASFEQRHLGVGLSLTELAALAASMEDLAHQESLRRLDVVLNALNFTKESVLNESAVERAIDAYLTVYIEGAFDTWAPEDFDAKATLFRKTGQYTLLQPWLQEIFQNVSSGVPRTVNQIERVVEAVDDTYGRQFDRECKKMKRELLAMEGRAQGRVRLSDFYNQTLTGSTWFWFGEKVDYLRTLGALDATNASNLQVIVANYVTSQTNCIRSSSAYDVCCRNECEDLMSELEGFVGAPEAEPDRLANLVASLESDTVKPQGHLSTTLQNQLQVIAHDNGGQVALHSRSFALWMHKVFPRECPFPHQAGSTRPLTADEWIKSTGESTQLASREEMIEYIRPDGTCSSEGDVHTDAWLNEEFEMKYMTTLLDQVPDAPVLEEATGSPLRTVMLACAALLAPVVAFVRIAMPAKKVGLADSV